ncbi:HDOD domain-containing protein [Marinomonas agarivorans]|nr:HDOD domain-containing protein [Marinomonas agarivorans]
MKEQARATVIAKARIVHLSDIEGMVQAIFPEDAMLDVSAIARITKRRLKPIPIRETNRSVLLNPRSIPTYIDKTLRHTENLLFCQRPDNIEHIQGDKLDDIFFSNFSNFSSISVSTAEIPTEMNDHLNDEGQMLKALGRFQSIRVRQRLEQTLELPPLPVSSQRILSLNTNDHSSTEELCKIINLDPSLSAQVVSWASSPYYGAPGEIKSVEDAIIRVLGFDLVMNLALGLSMGKVLEIPKNGPKHYNDYWFSAVYCASLMEAITQQLPYDIRPSTGQAYLTGLLHNFGYLAISAILPSHFSVLARYLEANTHLPANIVEMQLLRFTSEQMGTWLLRHWALPDAICNGIRYSKKVNYEGDGYTLATMLRICQCLMNDELVSEQCLAKLQMSSETLNRAFEQVNHTVDDLRSMAKLMQR